MRRFLRDAAGDMEKATEAARRLNQGVRGIQESIVRMRAEASRRGDVSLAGMIGAADPFQGGGRAAPSAARVPAIATPAAAAGITRTQAALFSLVFTIGNLGEQLATADTKWQKLDRTVGTALQTIANVAVFYGPTGLIVAGIAAAGNFLSSFWTQQREEIERTEKQAEEALSRLVHSRDNAAMMRRAQEIFVAGTEQSGYRGLGALESQRDLTALQIQTPARKREVAELTAIIAPLRKEFDALQKAILDVNNTPLEIKGAAGVKVTAGAPLTGDQATGALMQRAQELLSLQKALTENQRDSSAVVGQLAVAYRELNTSLDHMGEKWSAQAIQIRQIIEAIDKSPLSALLAGGGIPRASEIPSASGTIAPIAAGSVNIPQLDVLPVTLGERIRLSLQPMVDAIEKMGGYLVQAGLSMLSRYGGPQGQAAAGIIGGAIEGAQLAGTGGAILGAIVGLEDAILGLGESSRAAAESIIEAYQSQEQFLDGQRVLAGTMTQTEADVREVHRQFDAVRRNFTGTAEALAELNELERQRVEQIENQTDALHDMTEAAEQFRDVPSWFRTSLVAWRAAHPMSQQIGERLHGPTGTIPTAGSQTTLYVIQADNLNVNTRARSARELFDDLMQEAKRRGQATFGTGEEARILANL